MEPLSAIASVIAIAQALDMGIRGLKTLSNASGELSDMLSELSSLRACLDQLSSAVNTITEPHLSLPGEVITRLGNIRSDLIQVVCATEDIEARLSRRGSSVMSGMNKRGETTVSAIAWTRERGKAIKLRDRAKRCREDLSVCLALLGVSEQ